MAKRRRRKKRKTMDTILVALAVFLLVFVVTMIVLYCVTGGIPDVLCTCVFAACTGELSVCGWIKTNKDRAREEKEE